MINEGKVKKQCSKIPNWKAFGHDGVQGFCIKRLDKMHERIATQLNELLEGTKEISSWVTYGRTVLCQNDPVKGNTVENVRLITCLDMLGIADNVRGFLEKCMKKWKLLFSSNGSDLCEVDINRGIFQEDSLSALIFVICMIRLSHLLRKVKASYEWGRKEFKLNHLLFMDDLKLFGKSEDQIYSLIRTMFIFNEDIGMEFGLKKCGVVILQNRKLVKFDGIHSPNQEIMKEVDENGYTYLGILELDEIKEHEIKIKVTAEYKRRLRLILKSKLNGKNKIQAINTWAVALLRYGAEIINWKVDELKKTDKTMRKTLMMYGALHPKSDIDRLYLKRKHGGRGLISIEICVKSEENKLGLYVRESNEMLLKGVNKSRYCQN